MSICKKCLDFYISDMDPEYQKGLCNKCLKELYEETWKEFTSDYLKETGKDRL